MKRQIPNSKPQSRLVARIRKSAADCRDTDGPESRGGFVPKAPPRLAQGFSLGVRLQKAVNPEGTAEAFSRPFGTPVFPPQAPNTKALGYYRAPLRGGLVAYGVQLLLLLPGLCALAQTNNLDQKIPNLQPAHGEIQPTFWEQHGWWVILGAIFVLALLGLGIWLWLRPKPVVPVPPAQQARQTLQSLDGQPEDGVVLSRVSQVVRHYFGAAFGLPPGELTTAEFCRLLISRQDIGAPLSVPVTEFLRQCDERKFAPNASGAPLAAVGRARQLIEQAEARRGALAQPQATPSP